jgi:hypothetical protein
MTPTLLGRWQMRLLLLPTVGILATLPLAMGLVGPRAWDYYVFLLYIGLVGAIGDAIAQQLQKLRWDGDWPGILQLGGALGEALVLGGLLWSKQLPGISLRMVPWPWFLAQYALVSLGLFLARPSLVRILFPFSRWRGGQWW